MRRVRRHAKYNHIVLFRGHSVDAIKTRAPKEDTARAALCENLEYGSVEDIVDKDADSIGAVRKRSGVGVQPRVQEVERDATGLEEVSLCMQERQLERLIAEYYHAHLVIVSEGKIESRKIG